MITTKANTTTALEIFLNVLYKFTFNLLYLLSHMSGPQLIMHH